MNKVILIGRLGADPATHYSQSGTAICNFGLATNEHFTKNDEAQERTEWHRIVTFGKLAEIVRDNLTKGRQVMVEGRLQTRKWTDRDKVVRYSTEIVAGKIEFLGNKPGSSTTASPSETPDVPSDDPSLYRTDGSQPEDV